MLGDWVRDQNIIPTIEEVSDTLIAVAECPDEFDFDQDEALDIALVELDMNEDDLSVISFAKIAGK